MSKKSRMSLIVALILAALFLFPTMSSAAPYNATMLQKSVPTSPGTATFSALVTHGVGTGTLFTGGLSITIEIPGGKIFPYQGTYSDVNGLHLAVEGKFITTSPSNINQYITFYAANGAALIKAFSPTVYTFPSGFVEYAAKFQLYNGNSTHDVQVGSGVWSETFLNPNDELAGYSYRSKVTHGPHYGESIIGAIALHIRPLSGYLTLLDGTLIPLTVSYNSGSTITIVCTFPHGTVIATGTPTKNGYQGKFTGPATGDSGTWNAIYFQLP